MNGDRLPLEIKASVSHESASGASIQLPRRWIDAIILSVGWVTVLAGLCLVTSYEMTAGPATAAPQKWPASSIKRDGHRFSLIMFLHPMCPCSRASVGELEKILVKGQNQLQCTVMFMKPSDRGDEWLNTALRSTVRAIPGVKAMVDVDGNMARRFHATTSGDTFVYSSKGELLFHGGITASRGHAGDNRGRTAIEHLVDGQADCATNVVFGCPLGD